MLKLHFTNLTISENLKSPTDTGQPSGFLSQPSGMLGPSAGRSLEESTPSWLYLSCRFQVANESYKSAPKKKTLPVPTDNVRGCTQASSTPCRERMKSALEEILESLMHTPQGPSAPPTSFRPHFVLTLTARRHHCPPRDTLNSDCRFLSYIHGPCLCPHPGSPGPRQICTDCTK